MNRASNQIRIPKSPWGASIVAGIVTGALGAWGPRGEEEVTWTHAGITWTLLFAFFMAWHFRRLPVRLSWLFLLTGSGTAALIMSVGRGLDGFWLWWALQSALWGLWLLLAALVLTAAASWSSFKTWRKFVPLVLAAWYPASWLLCFSPLSVQRAEDAEHPDAAGRLPAISPAVIAPVIICIPTGPSFLFSYSWWGTEWIFQFYRPLNQIWFKTLGTGYYNAAPE